MPIHLYNTLTKQKEPFKPQQAGRVSMYHCGPTVYNYAHIGNLRAYIASDILRRVFELNDHTVSQIVNITDIGHLQHDDADEGDDKMTLALRREGKELNLQNMKELGLRYFDAFRSDIEKVNILPASLYPFASEHIDDDISFVQKLIDKGSAYTAEDGIYFDTTSLPEYGRLGGLSSDEGATESRIGDDEIKKSKKKNPRDFALWKFNDGLGYETPFGKGFPGWHIECSVMSMKYLGGLDEFRATSSNTAAIDWTKFHTFDIHTGGIDHIPVHHNNEIAQTEAISGKILANYWLHNAHLIFEGGKKMAKSGESFITLQTLEDHGISPLGFRYWTLGASYRTPLQFSYEALENAERSYRILLGKIAQLIKQAKNHPETNRNIEYLEKFKDIVSDDLNTPRALAFIYEEVINNSDIPPTQKIHLIDVADHVFGLDLITKSIEIIDAEENEIIPDDIKDLALQRLTARKEKKWEMADSLRNQIDSLGYEIVDTDDSHYIINKKLI